VKIIAPVTRVPQPQRIEIDLAKATLREMIPGWSKPAGKSGKITFQLFKQEGQIQLDKLVLESQDLLAKGQVQLSLAGAIQQVSLDTFKTLSRR
jgi:hypothetical protein